MYELKIRNVYLLFFVLVDLLKSVCFSEDLFIWSHIHVAKWYTNLCIYEFVLEHESRRKKRNLLDLNENRYKRELTDFFSTAWNGPNQLLCDLTEDSSNSQVILLSYFNKKQPKNRCNHVFVVTKYI